MDLTLIAYTASVFAALLAMNTYSHWGVAEVHTYSIPPYLEDRGYSSQIVANQVVDAMHRIQLEVASLNETDVVVQGQVQPVGQLASYFGIVELLRATEDSFGLGPVTVQIEITQHEELAHWRVRGHHAVRGQTVRQGDMPLEDPDALIERLGLEVIGYVSPFEALAYHFIQDAERSEYETTITVASTLLLDCERRWTWVCTDNNIQNAYLLRGMAYLSSDEPARAFDDFDSANKIGSQNALAVAFYGDAFAARGQEEAAQRQYERARNIDGDIGERFYQLARGYAQGGNHQLADRRYTTAADLGLDSEAFLVDWGDSLFALGWYEAALERYRRAEAANTETDLYAERIDRTLEAIDQAQNATPEQAVEPPAPIGPPPPAVQGG